MKVDVIVQNSSACSLSFGSSVIGLVARVSADFMAQSTLASTNLIQIHSTGRRLSRPLPNLRGHNRLTEGLPEGKRLSLPLIVCSLGFGAVSIFLLCDYLYLVHSRVAHHLVIKVEIAGVDFLTVKLIQGFGNRRPLILLRVLTLPSLKLIVISAEGVVHFISYTLLLFS